MPIGYDLGGPIATLTGRPFGMVADRADRLGAAETDRPVSSEIPTSRPRGAGLWFRLRNHAVSRSQPARGGQAQSQTSASGPAAQYRHVGAGNAPTIVVYHSLSTAKNRMTDQLGVTTDPEVFRRHVKYFARNFDIVGPDDLIRGSLPRKPLLITFDDVYRTVLDVGGPILREVDAPSLFFINPDSIVTQTVPIDNLLSLAVSHLGGAEVSRLIGLNERCPVSVQALISDHISQMSSAQTSDLKAALCTRFGLDEREIRGSCKLFLDAPDLRRLTDYGIRVGNHSMSHSFFRSLTEADLDSEIRLSRDLLEQMSGQSVTSLSIPYGSECDATDAALEAARSSGHRAIFLVHGRSNALRPAADVFYRISPRNAQPLLLPLSLRVLPHLRTAWYKLR